MSYSVMFALLLLTPLLFSLVLHSLGITLLLILALWVVQTAADAGEIFAAGLWLHIDGLGGLFLAILGVIGFLTGIYSIGYMRHEVAHGELSPVTLCDYYGFFHLFLFTMLLVVTSNNLIVMWAAMHGSTSLFVLLVSLLVCSVPCWYTPTPPALCRRQKWRYSGARFLSNRPCLTQH